MAENKTLEHLPEVRAAVTALSPEDQEVLAAVQTSPFKLTTPEQFSKTQNFLSKFLKSVRVQLANIHLAAYKNLPVTEVKLPGEGGTKKRCKPRKKACSGAFWRPREDLNLRPHA